MEPTRECHKCGCDVFWTKIMLDKDYSVGMYWLEAICAKCLEPAILATEKDFVNEWDRKLD